MSDDAIHDILEQTESDPAFHALFELFDYSNYDLLCFFFLFHLKSAFESLLFNWVINRKSLQNRLFIMRLQIKPDSLMAIQGREILAVLQKRATLLDLHLQSYPFRVMIQVFLQSNGAFQLNWEVRFPTRKVGNTSPSPTSQSNNAALSINSSESCMNILFSAPLSYLCLIKSAIHTVLSISICRLG